MTWQSQQVGVGISRVPVDTDMVECVPVDVLRAQMQPQRLTSAITLHVDNARLCDAIKRMADGN